jgi:hypothetical protein
VRYTCPCNAECSAGAIHVSAVQIAAQASAIHMSVPMMQSSAVQVQCMSVPVQSVMQVQHRSVRLQNAVHVPCMLVHEVQSAVQVQCMSTVSVQSAVQVHGPCSALTERESTKTENPPPPQQSQHPAVLLPRFVSAVGRYHPLQPHPCPCQRGVAGGLLLPTAHTP